MKLFAMLEKSPMTLLALAGVFLILAFLLRTRKVKLTTHQATCCGLLLALTLVLSLLPLYRMPYGGTITLGGMLPIMLIAFAYGPEVGIMAGFVYGLLNLLLNPYILQPVQVLFDYPLPFMALGLCGFFPRRRRAWSPLPCFPHNHKTDTSKLFPSFNKARDKNQFHDKSESIAIIVV